jgi:uroporphyrinogen-III synthase
MNRSTSRPSKKPARPAPLAGVRVLVGRARHQAGALSSLLREQGATVIELPFIEIRKPRSSKPLDRALADLPSYDWLILTSVNGVDALFERTAVRGVAPREFRHLQVAAIGPATRKAIESRGLKVGVVPKQYVAESVVRSLRSKVAGKRVLLVRARVARDVIPRELRALGAEVNVVEAYETVVPRGSRAGLRALFADPRRRPDFVTFTSSSTVRNFAALLGRTLRPALNGVRMVSIGPVTSATLRELDFAVAVEAQTYTIPGLVKAIAGAAQRRSAREQVAHAS